MREGLEVMNGEELESQTVYAQVSKSRAGSVSKE